MAFKILIESFSVASVRSFAVYICFMIMSQDIQ